LAIRRKQLGNDNGEVAWALDTLNIVLENEGKLSEAEEVIREALTISRRIDGDESPRIARIYERLGRTIFTGSTNRLEEAETYFRKALEIEQKMEGKGKPGQMYPHFSLAETLERQGKLAEAEGHYREALEIARKAMGVESPDLPRFLSGLAGILRKQGKEAEVKALVEGQPAATPK